MIWTNPDLCERYYYNQSKNFFKEFFELKQSSLEYNKYDKEEREKLEHDLDLISREVGKAMKDAIFESNQTMTDEQKENLFKSLFKEKIIGIIGEDNNGS